MSIEFSEFLPDIQSVNHDPRTGFALFCSGGKRAAFIQQQLSRDFGMSSSAYVDNDGIYYIFPVENLEDKTLSGFISRGWNWEKIKDFNQYTITLYNKMSATNIYNMLLSNRYDVSLASNNLQLIIKCLGNSEHDDMIQKLKCDLNAFENSSTLSMENYFNKILFNGEIENLEYRVLRKHEFDVSKVKLNKDMIVREILYQYFNKKIRAHLLLITFPRKFDANKLDDKTKQSIILIYEYLYSVTQGYINTQIKTAVKTSHKVIVRFDYLKSCNEFRDFCSVLKCAKQWHKSVVKKDKKRNKLCKISANGTYKVMDLDNGYYVARLFSPQSLDFETICLGHCVGKGHYDDKLYNNSVQLYSVRDKTGIPHLTLEVRNNKIVQCEGHKNQVSRDPILRHQVRTFMKKQQLDIDKWDGLIAYIKQGGVLYDVFDMPTNFVVNGYVDLSVMTLEKLPDMSTVTVNNNFVCASNNLSDLIGAPYTVKGDVECSNNPLISLRGISHNIGGKIYLKNTKLTGKSFIPLYMENKLNDIVGPDEKTINAWKQQISIRKDAVANIMASLTNHRAKE